MSVRELFFSCLILLNPLTASVPHHIETSQLICIANQLTGFYFMGNIGREWVNSNTNISIFLAEIFLSLLTQRCKNLIFLKLTINFSYHLAFHSFIINGKRLIKTCDLNLWATYRLFKLILEHWFWIRKFPLNFYKITVHWLKCCEIMY